jgi:hypothetical protein
MTSRKETEVNDSETKLTKVVNDADLSHNLLMFEEDKP